MQSSELPIDPSSEPAQESVPEVPVETPPVEAPKAEALAEIPTVEIPFAEPVQAPEVRRENISPEKPNVDFAMLREKKSIKKRARLEKILVFAKTQELIVNDDIEKLLHVSDATATRYLSQLVKEGRLERVGNEHRPEYRLRPA